MSRWPALALLCLPALAACSSRRTPVPPAPPDIPPGRYLMVEADGYT